MDTRNTITRHKKHIILFAVFALIALAFFWFNPFRVYLYYDSEANIVFNYGKSSINAEVSTDDAVVLRAILNGRLTFYDEPSCGFTDDVSIRFGDKVFCPACDGCPTVKYRDKYLGLTDSANKQLRDIMGKYGVYFPCV